MEFDLNEIKLSQDFAHEFGVKKELINVPVRKPDKQWFIRVHKNPEFHLQTAVLELKDDRETYIVAKSLWDELHSEITPKILLYCINKLGNVFIWPIRLPDSEGKIDEWNRTALEASSLAQNEWCRVYANMGLGSYDVLKAQNLNSEPQWPDKDFQSIMKIAFKDKYIDSLDHIAIKKLRGII